MSNLKDIKTKTQPATKGAVCRTNLKNQTAHGLAGDYADLVHHHNGRRQRKQPEPAEELDYDVEGIVPHN